MVLLVVGNEEVDGLVGDLDLILVGQAALPSFANLFVFVDECSVRAHVLEVDATVGLLVDGELDFGNFDAKVSDLFSTDKVATSLASSNGDLFTGKQLDRFPFITEWIESAILQKIKS